MKIEGIDSSRIESMLAQLKAAAQRPEADQLNVTNELSGTQGQNTGKVNFADALKASLDQVNQVQMTAKKLGESFAMGDDSVSLSDIMIASQKASISFQATVQVRNKLVSAYHDIMNMQV
jgi:flagellar hook-basal body complex protein FliE